MVRRLELSSFFIFLRDFFNYFSNNNIRGDIYY